MSSAKKPHLSDYDSPNMKHIRYTNLDVTVKKLENNASLFPVSCILAMCSSNVVAITC